MVLSWQMEHYKTPILAVSDLPSRGRTKIQAGYISRPECDIKLVFVEKSSNYELYVPFRYRFSMAIWTQYSALYHAIDDWQARGILDAETAERLAHDVEQQKTGRSFRTVLVLLAVICLGFGAVTFVAANWDDISRLTRLLIVFGAMWAAWGTAALFHARERTTIAQSFVLLACILFGAGIMLIGQIYHIQGEPRDAVWLWSIGTLVGAGLTRSVPALSFGVILLNIWYFMDISLFSSRYATQYDILAYFAVAGGLAYWLRSQFAGYLALLSLTLWTCANALAALEHDNAAFLIISLYGSYALLALALFSLGGRRILGGFELVLAVFFLFTMGIMTYFWYLLGQHVNPARYGALFTQSLFWPVLAGAITATLAILERIRGNQNGYDLIVTFLAVVIISVLFTFSDALPFVFEAFLLALSIWVIRMGWRLDYRPISTLGFVGFAAVMTTIYFSTIGTLIGTSAFYIGAGVLLLLGVFVMPRLMRKPEAKS